MICSKCNRENVDGAQFCSYCGNSFVAQTAPVAPVPVAQSVQQVQPVYQQPQKKGGFSTGQKITIIILLMGVVAALSLLLLFGNKNSDKKKVKDDTRTIMIYMVGSNLEYELGIATVDLESIDPSKIDLEKTNVLVYVGGTKEWKNNYISNQENAIFKLTSNGYEKLESYDKTSMGDPKNLSDFINYSYDNYKAGHYNLIIYDHGGAIEGAVYDDFVDDVLSLADFKKAMKDSPFNEDNKLDAVLFRTCLNGTLEVASIFEPYSEYIVFSEEISYGGNNTNVLSFINNLETSDEGKDFGVKFVDQYKVQMEVLDFFGTMGVTYSVVDLSKINKVNEELDKFIAGVDVKTNYANISRVRGSMYQYAYVVASDPHYDTVDLYSLVDGLSNYSSVDASGVKNAIKDAVICNHTNIDSSNGISIYFPYNGRGYREKFLGVYKNLSFSDNYKKFITNFYNAQSSASSFAYDFSKNETKSVEGGKEVSIKLTEEQANNYSGSIYTLFKRDEHPNYYQFIYNSNDAKLSEDGTLTTNIGDNLITARSEDTTYYLPIIHRKNGNYDTYNTSGVMFDRTQKITAKEYRYTSTVEFAFKEGKPFIASARVTNAADERTVGQLLNFNVYNYVEIYCFEYKLLDSKGKLYEEFESAPTTYGIGGELDELELERATIGSGEYYVLFSIYDVNNETYRSELIKVGA